jgi:FKBP-type peptidyl-prolyl cis-trans isomerase FklB
MKPRSLAVLGVAGLLAVSALAVGQDKPDATELKDLKAKASYSIGIGLGQNIRNMTADVDVDLIAKGIRDGMAGGKYLLTEEQIKAALQEYQEQLNAKHAIAAKAIGEKNKKEGEAFLAENKKKPGVVALPSGLQYKELAAGTGKTPKATDTVSTHYKGTLINGTEFDSSYKRGQPASFPVNGVIPGWTEALQKMKVGSKWQLFIPGELAYGENPPPGSPIGPNSVLLFEIQLLGVQ